MLIRTFLIMGLLCGCVAATEEPGFRESLGDWDAGIDDLGRDAQVVAFQRSRFGLDTSLEDLAAVLGEGLEIDEAAEVENLRFFLSVDEQRTYPPDKVESFLQDQLRSDLLAVQAPAGLHGVVSFVSGPMELTTVIWVDDAERFALDNSETLREFRDFEMKEVTWTEQELSAAATVLDGKGRVTRDGRAGSIATFQKTAGGLSILTNGEASWDQIADELDGYEQMIVLFRESREYRIPSLVETVE